MTPLDGTLLVHAPGDNPTFAAGDRLRIKTRKPVGHYRVPIYLRGKCGQVERIVEPAGVNNEEEGFGRNAGSKGHYYRLVLSMVEVWPNYSGTPQDELCIEVFETWLEREFS